jgi:porphobilinogen deaminase
VVVSLDGARLVTREARGTAAKARDLGARVARELLAGGAGEILADVERAQRTTGEE